MPVPALVPCPQTSTVTPEEGRLLSESDRAPRAARLIERDERQFQTLTWTLTAEQAAAFRDWWRTDLTEGGAWFDAPDTWPTPEGFKVKLRRFVGAPSWGYMGVGVWQVACDCEVRSGTPSVDDVVEVVYFTSELYPYDMGEESVSIAASLLDGTLVDILISYINWRDVAPEAISVGVTLIDGMLVTPTVSYVNWRDVAPEALSVGVTLIDGMLVTPTVSYVNWRDVAPEALSVGVTLLDGTLTVVVINYVNWRDVAPEALSVGVTLLDGTLT